MKICYVDDSGVQATDPVLVMTGIIVDAQRARRTRGEFASIFRDIERRFPEALKELKGVKILHGRDRWRKVDPADRKAIVHNLCNWVVDRKHDLALAAIKRNLHGAVVAQAPPALADLWLAAGFHIALQLQKHHQRISGGKGQTYLVLDENKAKIDTFSEMLFDPPAWSDTFYARGKKQEALDHVIDSAFFAKSHHVGLVQVADVFAFIFRRYAELTDCGIPEEYDGEAAEIASYVKVLRPRLLPVGVRWPKRTASSSAKWFCDVAPGSLSSL